MTHARHAALITLLALTVAACGSDDDAGSPPTSTPTLAAPTATATAAPPTLTATLAPSATATAAATETATAPPPSATATATPTEVEEPTATPTETAEPVDAGAMALFHLDPRNPANPFPSDRLLDETGHVDVTGEVIGADLPAEPRYNTARALSNIVAEQLRQLDGFSTFAPVRIKFDAPVRAPEEDGVAFLFPCDGEDVPLRLAATDFETSGDDALELYPRIPLRPKSRYIYAVTRDLLDAEGRAASASPELAEALASDAPDLVAWRARIACGLERLADVHGVGVEDLIAIDAFTTQPTTDDLHHIRRRFESGELPPPAPSFERVLGLTVGIFPEGTPEFAAIVGSETSETIAKVVVGTFPSLDFRKDFGAFDPEMVYGDTPPAAEHLDFRMTIPKGEMPPAGFPITLFGHGLGGSSENVVATAKLLGDTPIAVIGISAVQHGRRGSVTQFFNLVDGFATREHFRQSVADMMQLVFMIRHAEEEPFDVIDKERIHYFGVSLGGIMGTLLMGVEPDVRVAVLSVPGGGLPNILRSEAIGSLLRPLISLTVGIPQNDPNFEAFLYRFTHLSQWVLDAGDPINTAPLILDPERALAGVPVKRILMQEGFVDTVVPNETTEDLARAMRLTDAKASAGCESEDGCSGIWRFVMTEYGEPENSGHSVTGVLPEAAAQVSEYLLSDGTRIIDASPTSP